MGMGIFSTLRAMAVCCIRRCRYILSCTESFENERDNLTMISISDKAILITNNKKFVDGGLSNKPIH